MNRLSIAVGSTVLAGMAYLWWPQSQEAPVKRAATSEEKRVTVPFVVRAKVKVIWEQHLRMSAARSQGDAEPARTRIRLAVLDIKERLFSDGVTSTAEILDIVRAAAAEVGLSNGQTAEVVAAFQANSNRI